MSGNLKNRKLNRLKKYDYSQSGYYFVTVCTKNRIHWFGEIRGDQMVLNECGEIVLFCWKDLPNHYFNAELDQFVIMPNHIHGIVRIVRNGFKPFLTKPSVGNGLKPFPTMAMKCHGLSEIIRGLKTFSSRKINEKTTNG